MAPSSPNSTFEIIVDSTENMNIATKIADLKNIFRRAGRPSRMVIPHAHAGYGE